MYDPSALFASIDATLNSAQDIKEHLEESSKSRGKCVMILDDGEIERTRMRRDLEGAGYTVLESHSGEELIEGEVNYDFVITDLMMPCVDGLEVIKFIESTNRVGALVISGMSINHETVVQVRNMDVPFLEKPYSKKKLLQVVHDYLGSP